MSSFKTVSNPDDRYLLLLGERVRAARLRRGMTRQMLSVTSGVSERYLAQLESGKGNISIRRLRQIAQAMDISLGRLVEDAPDPPVELTLIEERLKRLSPDQLQEVQQFLGMRFPLIRRMRENIALIGLRGAGKTTLGRHLAADLELEFVSLVDEIEHQAGLGVAELLALSGQAGYQRLEAGTLRRVLEERRGVVIETGGGIVAEPGTFNLLLNACFTVWIRATPEEHMSRVIAQGDARPIAGSREAMADLRRILAAREPFYRKADVVLDTSGREVSDSLAELTLLCRDYLRRFQHEASRIGQV